MLKPVSFLLLGLACASVLAAQSTARFSLGGVSEDAATGRVTLDVEARRLQSTRTFDVRVVADARGVRWDSVAVGPGAAGMTVLDRRQTGDTLSVVLSYLSRASGVTLLRTTPVITLHGTRLLDGPLTFALAAPPVAVVSRSGTVQPVELGEPVVTTDVDGGESAAARHLGAWPNPAREAFTIGFESTGAGQAHVTVYDALGRAVLHRAPAAVTAGPQRLAVPAHALAPGLYLYRLTVEAAPAPTVFTGRITVVR